jgi:hypothetical protein
VVTTPRVRWVVLVYRVPRDPSSPRIAVWRQLRRLGAAQLGDGVVALPEDARTREQLEWVAERVVEIGGTALLMRSETLTNSDERRLVAALASTRADEYAALTSRVRALLRSPSLTPAERRRALKAVRRQLREVRRRDHFPPEERETAATLVAELGRRWVTSGPTSELERSS